MGSWDCENYICPKVTNRESIIITDHRMANSCEGALRGQQHIISKYNPSTPSNMSLEGGIKV